MENHFEDERRQFALERRQKRCSICRIYAKVLANFYPLICVAVLLISLICGLVSFLLFDLPDFSEPTKGFQARGTPITNSLVTNKNYREYDVNVGNNGRDLILRRRRRDTIAQPSIGQNATEIPDWGNHKQQPYQGSRTHTGICTDTPPSVDYNPSLVFKSKTEIDLLSVNAMKSMCRLELDTIRQHHLFSDLCWPCYDGVTIRCPDSWSLGGYVALLSNKTSCDAITAGDSHNFRTLLHTCAPYYLDGTLLSNCAYSDECSHVPHVCTAFDAVYNIFHLITPGSFVKDIAESRNTKLTVAATFIPIIGWGDDIKQIYLDNIHERSIADDHVSLKAAKIFIRFDLFEQFLFSDTLYVGIALVVILILLWIYTKSFLVMLAAFLNFILSLVLAYFFYVVVFQRPFFPFVNITALILLTGIGADDTFVYIDLWRKAISDNRGESLVVIVEDALYHATATMFVTSFTTTSALFASMVSNVTAIKCFALFSGISIMMNFLLTLSWLPSVIILQHRLMELYNKNRNEDNISHCSNFLERFLNPIQVFYDKILPFIVVKFRYVWLISFTLLGLAGAVVVFYRPGLNLPTSSDFQVLRSENYLEQYALVYKNQFNYEKTGSRMPGIVIFGVDMKYNGDPWDPDDYGELFIDEEFDFSTPDHQVWLDEFCDELRNQSFFHIGDMCLMTQLKTYMQRDCAGGALMPCCNASAFPFSSQVFKTCFTQCIGYGACRLSIKYSEAKEKVVAFDMSFLTTTYLSFDYNKMNEFWMDVNGWMERQFKTAPESLSSAFFTSQNGDQLWFFDLQKNLATGTQISLGVTLAITTCILICTILNVLLALYAIMSVTFVVFVTIGILVLLGWELNIFESVIFTLAVGLSVDFTIHYGVAYSLAPQHHRIERTEYSIQTMGSAITFAALSTFIAGALMLPVTVNAYLQLGIFLMIVMSISWVYSTFYFQTLCMIFGPHGKFGQINYCCIDTTERTETEPIETEGHDYGKSDTRADTINHNNSQTTESSKSDIDGITGDINATLPSNGTLPGTTTKDNDVNSEKSLEGDQLQMGSDKEKINHGFAQD